MIYSKAIFLMSGEVITITEEDEKKIKQSLIDGAEWIGVQNELINAKSIAKIGNHHATAQMKRLEKYQEETNLKLKEPESDYYLNEAGEKMYS